MKRYEVYVIWVNGSISVFYYAKESEADSSIQEIKICEKGKYLKVWKEKLY